MKYASLCVLAYKRPNLLPLCLDSLIHTSDYPFQLIVNLDAGDESNLDYVLGLHKKGLVSNIIINGGDNRGVGRSFQNCLGVAEGDYIFKIDTDLIFKPNWLSTAVNILKNNSDIGAISLFDYNHYDPNDSRFKPLENHLEEREDCTVVKDFVSSIYGFRRLELEKAVDKMPPYPGIPDDGLHQQFGKMAITKQDFVENKGFGVNSVYVTMPDKNPENAFKTPTFNEPLIFRKGLG